MSLHFRGPLRLKQVAVYLPANEVGNVRQKRQVQKQEEEARPVVVLQRDIPTTTRTQMVEVTDMVVEVTTVTEWETLTVMECDDETFTMSLLPTTSTPSAATTTLSTIQSSQPVSSQGSGQDQDAQGDSSSTEAGSLGGPAGGMKRTGYYSAEKEILEGMVFLANFGGQGSGSWSS